MRQRWPIALLLLLAACALLHHVGGLRVGRGYRPLYVHDECYQAFTAHRYALGDPHAWGPAVSRAALAEAAQDDLTPQATYEWVHPPGAKLVMAAFIRLLGFTPFAFRLGSVLAGLLCLLGVYLLGEVLFDRRTGLLAAALLALDGLFFALSRAAMNDIYVTAAVVWTCYAAARAWPMGQGARRWLCLVGLLAGLCLTLKWSAAPLLALLALLLLIQARRRVPALLSTWPIAFVLAPPLVYLLVHLPYFLAGHGLGDLLRQTRDILRFHAGLAADHSAGARWWEWPLMVRPVWLSQVPAEDGRRVRALWAFGNPLLWWALLPAVSALCVAGIRGRVRGAAAPLLVLGFLALWLPWALVSRVSFLQYLLPAVPLGILALAWSLVQVGRRGSGGRWAASTYVLLVALCFANLYPILTGAPVTAEALASRRWFWLDSWRPRPLLPDPGDREAALIEPGSSGDR